MAGNKQIFDSALQKAQEYAINNQWNLALPEYMRAATEFPKDLTTRSSIALALLKLGLYDKALIQYEGLARVSPNDPLLLTRIVEIYHRTNQTDKTVENLLRLKAVYLKQGQNQEAIEVLNDAADLDPEKPEISQELFELAEREGQNEIASNAALRLTYYYQKQQDLAQAAIMAKHATRLNPANMEAENLFKSLNTDKDFYSDFLEELPSLDGLDEPALQTSGDVDNLIAEAEAALEAGHVDEAINKYEQAVKNGTHRADIYYSLGNLYVQNGEIPDAIEYLIQATSDKEYAPSAYYTLGQLYDQENKLAEAVEAYENTVRLIDVENVNVTEAEELIDMYEVVGECYERAGEEAKAAELYNRLAAALQLKNIRSGKVAIISAKSRELNERLNNAKKAASPGPLFPSETRNEPEAGSNFTPSWETPKTDPDESSYNKSSNAESYQFNKNTSASAVSSKASDLSSTPPTSKSEGTLSTSPAKSHTDDVFFSGPLFTPVYPKSLVNMELNQMAVPYLKAAEDFMQRDLVMAAIDACHELIRLSQDYLPAQAILSEIYIGQNKIEQARVKYQYIVNLYQMRNEPLKAIEVYKRLTEISPENQGMRTKLADMMLQYGQKEAAAEILLTTIQNLVKTGHTEQALEDCKKLRNLAPQSVPVRLQYGELLNRLNDYSAAAGEFRRALELEPANLRALVLLNITLFLSNEGVVKWSSFKTVLDRSRDGTSSIASISGEYLQALYLYEHAGLHYALGCIQLESQEINAATRSFEQAAQEAVTNKGQAEYELLARFQLGQLRLKANRFEESIQEYSKVLSLLESSDPQLYADSKMIYGALPTQVAIYRDLSKAFIVEKKIDYAIKSLKTVKRLLPYDREVHFQLAELSFQRGQLNEALGELGELADHYEEVNQPDDTIEVLKEMVRLAPNNIPVRDRLSNIYMKRGLTDAGLQELDELSELQRKNGRLRDAVKTLQRAAETYWLMMRQDKAFELYDRIVRISPGDIEARQQLVNLHILGGRMKDAVEEQRMIAQICLQTKGQKEAIGALHQVISLAPEDTRAYFALAQVLTDTGEYGQAYKLYGRILKIAPDNSKAQNLQFQIKNKAIEAGQLVSSDK